MHALKRVLGGKADSPKGIRRSPRAQRPFYVALREKGWILGDNLQAEPAYAEFKVERLPELAEQTGAQACGYLSIRESDLAAVAAARASETIPNYFYNVSYPVELGLIDSYVRPGRNPTGRAARGSRSLCSAIASRAQFLFREMVESGGLLSYGAVFADPACADRAGVEFVDRLLRGTRPAEVARRGPAAVPAGDEPQDRDRPRVDDPAVVAVAAGFGLAVNAGAGPASAARGRLAATAPRHG